MLIVMMANDGLFICRWDAHGGGQTASSCARKRHVKCPNVRRSDTTCVRAFVCGKWSIGSWKAMIFKADLVSVAYHAATDATCVRV